MDSPLSRSSAAPEHDGFRKAARVALDAAPEALAFVAEDGGIFAANAPFRDLFKLEGKEALQVGDLLSDADDRQALLELLTAAATGKGAASAPLVTRRRASQPLRWRGRFQTIAGIAVIALSVIPIDSDQSAGAEQRLLDVLAGSLQGVVVYDDGGPVFCTEIFARIFGYGSSAQFLREGPRDFHDLIVSEQREAFRGLTSELTADHPRRADQHYELRACHADGHEIWIDLKRRPLMWEGRKAQLATVYDITRRKTSELRLHEYEGLFQRLIDSTQAVVFYLSPERHILLVNRAFESFVGRTRMEVVGETVESVIDNRLTQRVAPLFSRVLAGETVEFNETIRDSGGARRSLSAQLVPETTLSGAVRGVFCVALDITEREAAAQALRQSEARYRVLIEGSLQAIALLQNSEPIFVNETFARIFGCQSSSDYLAKGVKDIADHFFMSDRPEISAILAMGPDQSLPHRECRVRGPDGRELWLEYLVRPCVIGEETLFQFTALDITARKTSAIALHESELLLRNLIDASPAQIACLDRWGRYEFVNEPLAELLGVAAAEIRSTPANFDERGSRFGIRRSAFTEALSGAFQTFQSEIHRSDGSILIIENHYRPRWNGEEIVGVFVVAFDVTARERSVLALRESEERFRNLIEIMPNGIVRISRDGIIRLSNTAHDEMLGYRRGDLEGACIWDLFVPEEQEMQRQAHLSVMSERSEQLPNLGRYMHKNGRIIDVLFNRSYEYDENGRVDGLIMVITDVTEELSAKRELHFAKEQAERANVEKSRFLAATSHDLQQPLHSLSIMLGLLGGQKDEAKRRTIVTTMGRALEGARVLLRSVLDLSKLEAGVVVPHPEAIDVEELLEQVVAELGPQTDERHLELRVARTSATIWSDRVLIKSIFHNLVSNAIRYTRQGKILIGGRRRGDHFLLQVWDTGRGIPQDKQKEIFREFARLDNAQDDGGQTHALGLGLSIVERMCDLLGHRISVQSEMGRGSVFTVEVPLARKPTAPRAPHHGSLNAPPVLRSGLILLLEDDAATALATRQLIEQWGHRCLVAMNKADALAMTGAAEQIPDLIIADYNLGENVTGIEVAQAVIKAAGRTMPAILLTANDSAKCLGEARQHDMPVMSKPANPARLRALVSFSLAQSQTAAAES